MGLALKEITADLNLPDESESQQQWNSFCNGDLRKYEIKWTRKLEDYTNGKLIEEDQEAKEEDDRNEDQPF